MTDAYKAWCVPAWYVQSYTEAFALLTILLLLTSP